MEYRLYYLDSARHIVSAKDVVVPDDLAALQEAEKACGEHAIEVWQGARKVAHVKLGNAPLDLSDGMSL